MNGCQDRQSWRRVATSTGSCSSALRLFFVRQAEPAQGVTDRGQAARLDATYYEFGLDLGQGDGAPDLCQLPQQRLVPGQQRLAGAADPSRCRAASLAHAPDQLDRSGLAHREPSYRLARRTARLHRLYQATTQILRQRYDHPAVPRCSTSSVESDQTSSRNSRCSRWRAYDRRTVSGRPVMPRYPKPALDDRG